jgi:hypothetical protein
MNGSEQQSIRKPTEDTVTDARVAKPRARVSKSSARPRTRKPKRQTQAGARKAPRRPRSLPCSGVPLELRSRNSGKRPAGKPTQCEAS